MRSSRQEHTLSVHAANAGTGTCDAHAVFDRTGKPVAGTAGWLLAQADREAKANAAVHASLSSGTTSNVDGMTAEPMLDAQGEVVGVLVHHAVNHDDATNTVLLTPSIEQDFAELCHALSHELRTPLRAVQGFASMLARRAADHLDPGEQHLLAVIRENSETAGRMLVRLVGLTQVIQASMTPRMTDMASLVHDAWLDEGERFVGAIQIDDALPEAFCDRMLMKRVWCQLLNNAVKFRQPDVVGHIRVSGQRGTNECSYEVSDDGLGFDRRYASRLFGIYQRLHAPDAFPGEGIGLAIVARIVGRHGGRVWARGDIGTGATFGFSLPHGDGA
ncbi:MAG: hypothetical protein JO218_01230 [Burkholderiales bacterium]|nr:hypothetical protein [Burkholderiales bacterium]